MNRISRLYLPLAFVFAFALPPLLVGGAGVGRAMLAALATAPSLSTTLPAQPAYDPSKPTAVVVAGNHNTESSDLLGPYETLATSGQFNVYVAAPSNLDLSTQRPTAEQHFVVSYTPSVTPPPINQLHTWTVRVTTPDGQPVEGAKISVDGDMPQHGHGLPTRPQVTRYLGDGRYLVEGMKFQMGGWWVADFTIADTAGLADTVRFNFILG